MPYVSDTCVEWRENGQLHRDGDLPAVITVDKSVFYYQRGRLHRIVDKPAAITANGDKYWCLNGRLHRDPILVTVGRYGQRYGQVFCQRL
jgi:hypothetical protein